MKGASRRKRRTAIAVALLVLGAIGAAIPFAWNWRQGRDFSHRLGRLEASRRVADTEALVAGIPPRLTNEPQLAESLATARIFLAREKGLKRTFDEDLSVLEQLASTNSPSGPAQTGPRRSECESALAALAPEFQTAGKSNLAAWDANWQKGRNQAFSDRLDRAEQIAARVKGTNGYEAVHAALTNLQSDLAAMGPWRVEPPALDPNLRRRFLELSNTLALGKGLDEQWEKARDSLAGAQSFEDYTNALAQLARSPFASVAQRGGAAAIDHLKIDQTALLGELLLPGDRADWSSLTNLPAWRTNLMPETPTAHEKDVYFNLRDDKNMRNVYAYQLIANSHPNNPFQTHPVFAQGLIATNRLGRRAGLVFDPSVSRDRPQFTQQSYDDWDYSDVKMLFRTQECESFERLGLGDLIDPNTGNYQKPILQLLDQLNHETNASAVFRAVVTLRLFDLAEARPEEWGLRWCPGADPQGLKDLGAQDLKSGDWLVRAQVAKYEAPLQKYFQRAGALSLEKQAKFLQQIVRETCAAGFSYAGYVDGDGRPVTRQVNSTDPNYWGWGGRGPSACLLFRKRAGAEDLVKMADPVPFTPLFVFLGDRQDLLNQAGRATAYPASQQAAILPPFFAQSHE